jgi:hypothetical protein
MGVPSLRRTSLPVAALVRRRLREAGLHELRVQIQPLRDATHLEPLVGGDERDALATATGPCRATYTMNVRLVVSGRIEVDHVCDVLEVEAARGDVGRDEHVVGPAGEPPERSLALGL